MQRYTVTVIDSCSPEAHCSLAVPFHPSALVSDFVDELFRRIAKQGLKLTATSHIATLHLDSPTGAIIDFEDVLSDTVTNPRADTIFAVFAEKQTRPLETEHIRQQLATSSLGGKEDGLAVRFVTAALAKRDKVSVPPVTISLSATIKQLHELAAKHTNLPAVFEADKVNNECNCNLAKQIAEGPSSTKDFFLVHGKSIVKRIVLNEPSETAVDVAIQSELGLSVFADRKIFRHSGESQSGQYTRLPTVAICSKERHVPVHSRTVEVDDGDERRYRLVDLHTAEQPISALSMSATLSDAGLTDLALDGIVDIFVVNRATTGSACNGIGQSVIFRARPHWEPTVPQNARGTAMFLSSLRVFASLVPSETTDARMKDAVLHVADLILRFPPCTRALHLLFDGKTLAPSESAAVAQAVYETLHGILMPIGIIGTDTDRVFEGARLLFGFILEKARTLKLSLSTVAEGDELPYLASFKTIDMKDFQTAEPVIDPVQTISGVLERSLFEAFNPGGVLCTSHLQPRLAEVDILPSTRRHTLLAGGVSGDVTIFDTRRLALDYRYPDTGDIEAGIDTNELSQLSHLAEVAARNQLSVHSPAQLASAVAPCLTFDRAAHLAVYTGQQACGTPGESNLVFQPMHGESTMNATVIEQLIAPILKLYESNGSIIFDSYGGAVLRRLQDPDELLFFCVDTSFSMQSSSDFKEVHEQSPISEEQFTPDAIVEVELYGIVSFDDMKDFLGSHEAFRDMLAIVSRGHDLDHQRGLASNVISLLRMLVGNELVAKHEQLQSDRENAGSYYARQAVAEADSSLRRTKTHWAGLKTHEEALQDFLIYRATTSSDVNADWQWNAGGDLPGAVPPTRLSSLPEAITNVPDAFMCPISRGLMEDAVKASDGFTYSRAAIEQWFAIRTSSPMTGLPLQDTNVTSNDDIASAVANWTKSTDLQETPQSPAKKKIRLAAPKRITVTFLSKDGKFKRDITPQTTIFGLYQIAFRGMRARFMVFQLALDNTTTLWPPNSSQANSKGIRNGEQITVRIADETTAHSASAGSAQDHALIKVYHEYKLLFSFWVPRQTSNTLETIIWKYWRHNLGVNGHQGVGDVEVWSDLTSSGDNRMTGYFHAHTDSLAHFLNISHCHGKLEDEPLCAEHGVEGFNAAVSSTAQPLVLKVMIGAPTSKSNRDREGSEMTRLDVLKQMFEAYINRAIAYGYKTHMGLVTFDSVATVKTSLTHVVENFRRSTAMMEATGDTSLWDALALCRDQLNESAKKYPGAKKRIIVISDGKDTKSMVNKPGPLAFDFRQDKTIVDSVNIGDENSRGLRTLSELTGGYRFKPTSLVNALSMVELEPFLSLTERPDTATILPTGAPSYRASFQHWFKAYKHSSRITPFGIDNYPPRREHTNLHDDFIELTAASSRPAIAPQDASRSHLRTARLMNEMKSMLVSSGQRMYDVYVSESDMSFWKVVMMGPEGSAYENGTFLLYLHAAENYPTFAPEVRFVTRIMHPNINAHGRICHALLGRDWTSDITMTALLDTVFGLLMQAELSDPINTTTTLDYHHDQIDFADEVRNHVTKHASRSRSQWKRELVDYE